MNSYLKQIKDGVLTNNPVLVQFIGMCPVLAISTTLSNGIGMGLAVIFVLICSNIVISLLRNVISPKIRIASYIVIIAGFVSIVDMVVKAYLPDLASTLGIFIPLIVVNCIILARAESFASKNKLLPSIVDGLSMGLGFAVAICILATVREIIGKGSITLWGDISFDIVAAFEKAGFSYPVLSLIASPAGAFITLGFIVAFIQFIANKRREK